MIKKLLYLVFGIIALFLVVAAFLPKSYTVERSTEIAKPPEVVFSQISDYNRWLEWSPWPKMDPAAKQTVTGDPGTVGQNWAWEGEQVGVGSMTIAHIEENKSLHSKLVFLKPMTSEADDYVTLEPSAAGTRVTWRNTGELPYPLGRYFGLSIEGMLGPQFEEGLANLKSLSESLPEPAPMMPTMEETATEAPTEQKSTS